MQVLICSTKPLTLFIVAVGIATLAWPAIASALIWSPDARAWAPATHQVRLGRVLVLLLRFATARSTRARRSRAVQSWRPSS